MLIMLQTHFNNKYKRLVQFILAVLCITADIVGRINQGETMADSIHSSGTRVGFILASFLCFGFFSDRVVSELFK